jgi:hypothetical protein
LPSQNAITIVYLSCFCSQQKYREWLSASPTVSQNESDDEHKNERKFFQQYTTINIDFFSSFQSQFFIAGSESGFDSINDGMFNGNSFMHIPLNIPLPPARKPPNAPISLGDFSPQHSPVPPRKFHKQPIPDINFIESTPSPILSHKGNQIHDENQCLIENDKSDESSRLDGEIKIDELNVEASNLNVRKEGIIADKIEQDEHLDIKIFPKDRA